jgi:hypothetical protein
MIKVAVATLPLLLLLRQTPQAPAASILGTWRGTSTCADKAHDTACHDEVVIYEVDSSASARGPVRWVADKVVNGTRENMGVLRLQYDTTTHMWSTDLNMRIAARWSLEPRGDRMVGTLAERPSGRIIRRVSVRRVR